MALNLQDAIGLPLGLESLAFRSFADRAVSLPAIEAIKRVALLAMGFLGVDVAHRCGVALRVLGRQAGIQVLRVHAVTIMAGTAVTVIVGESA